MSKVHLISFQEQASKVQTQLNEEEMKNSRLVQQIVKLEEQISVLSQQCDHKDEVRLPVLRSHYAVASILIVVLNVVPLIVPFSCRYCLPSEQTGTRSSTICKKLSVSCRRVFSLSSSRQKVNNAFAHMSFEFVS